MFQYLWYQMGRAIVYFYVRFILRADIHRQCSLPKGAKIIVANHPSTNDPAFVTLVTNEQATILIKDTLFKVPLFGRSLRMAGHVPVVAGKGRAALEEGIRLLKAGRTIVIFPEGEISPEGGFNKFHTGAARLALATGAPVIPVGISLNQRRLRLVHTRVEGQMETGCWYLKGPYGMTIGKPITFQGDVADCEHVRMVTGQLTRHVAHLSRCSEMRLCTDRTPRLSTASPKTAVQVVWKGTWITTRQYFQAVTRSAAFRAAESMLVVLLMYMRHG